MDSNEINIGLDIGSISLNTVIINHNGEILENHYDYCYGQPFLVLKKRLTEILSRYKLHQIKLVSTTGTAGKLATELIGGQFVNEIIAQSKSVSRIHPNANTIIEIGGEDSKLIFMERGNVNCHSQLSDFNMNSICAAGTGSFLDQQAKRIGVSIENEFGELALKSVNPPRIAGRCSVFAKSDMIHLQQIATPVYDIVAGLCFAVARNFKSNLARGKDLNPPVIFQGGVAANKGVVHAFRQILDLRDSELIIPKYYASMGAIGSVFYSLENSVNGKPFEGVKNLDEYLLSNRSNNISLPKLKESLACIIKETQANVNGNEKIPVYLGLDVGSLSTNLVLIDEKNRVISRKYLPTASRPLEAIQKGLTEIFDEVGQWVEVKAAGTTGSGRYLTGDFVGADTIQNEITAQATAALAYDSSVDTIFEIGGQDSKYISIDNGVVVDFEMNKVCAAGTGSFLEEQAEKLNINIVEEFGNMSLNANHPCSLGSRCTVFIESDLNTNQQKGVSNENLVGGLSYSIVNNYIQKVVGTKRIGKNIFFQGGVANNKGVVAAFEQITGKSITIPPNFDVTGAIGMAILAREKTSNNSATKFKGFDIRNVPFSLDKFTCKECTNHCEIRTVNIEGESKALYYGGRCEKYEMEDRKKINHNIPNLFNERETLLLGDYKTETNKGKTSIGIPRELSLFYQEFPFWRTFFTELGFQVILSKPTNRKLVAKSLEMLNAETCFPVEVVHGHVFDLLEKKVDYIFVPFVVNNRSTSDNPTSNCNCPWIQTYPFMVKAALTHHPDVGKLLIPTFHPRWFDRVFTKEISHFMHQQFGIESKKVKSALIKAIEKQTDFENSLVSKGVEILKNLNKDDIAFVILGRPYNTGDPELNLRLVEKIITQGVLPIPLDYLPLADINIFNEYPNIYWPNGRQILSGARIVANDKRLHAVYLTNFRCGPDSFLSHFVTEELKGKPSLQIEIDEHSADAGLITRLEAFLDSVKKIQYNDKINIDQKKSQNFKLVSPSKERVLYFPYMNDGSHIAAAAARSCGIESWSLPAQTQDDLDIGRKYTSSKECFPMICTTGSFIRKLLEPGINEKNISFFMPDHNGPCRFGQYNQLQKVIFDHLGKKDVKIVTPSNDGSYEDIAGGKSSKFRINAWKGFVALDMLRKLQQERRPYEKHKGETDCIYFESLKKLEYCIENNAKNLINTLSKIGIDFESIQVLDIPRKPVISIVGEIFMRDNNFCNGNIISKLESLGAETLISPFSEWLIYSTYRYNRDSHWKGDYKGIIKSKIQEFSQNFSYKKILHTVEDLIDIEKEVTVAEMLKLCNPYVHKDYDGDPVIALGTASSLARKNISGICNILPFTCMPGTLICSVSEMFRKNNNNIPWVDYAYDGQDDVSLETRMQAFMYQAKEYSRNNIHSDVKL